MNNQIIFRITFFFKFYIILIACLSKYAKTYVHKLLFDIQRFAYLSNIFTKNQ